MALYPGRTSRSFRTIRPARVLIDWYAPCRFPAYYAWDDVDRTGGPDRSGLLEH